jgi:spore maturation protein CgeB
MPHGFDPDLHRPMAVSPQDLARLGADAAFIGMWSPKKTAYMQMLVRKLPGVHARIWGGAWERAHATVLKPAIMGRHLWGDVYPLAMQCTKVNIALLSEARTGASSGDRITSRTFHIPASGGFMLHERTDELLQYYREGDEVACFASPEELAEKTQYYLEHEEEREAIRLAGHRRCVAENSLVDRAQVIVQHYRTRSAVKEQR